MEGSTIIGIVVCIIVTVVSVVLGVYFSGVTCPDFGYECPSSPDDSTAAGTPGPPGPATGTQNLATQPPAAARTPGPATTPTTPPQPCPTGQWSATGSSPCNQCSEPNYIQYVTAICTSTQDTEVAPVACPAGSSTQDFSTGSSLRLGSRTCVQDVAPTVLPQGQTCPPGQQIVNGICNVCPPGYNYNPLIRQCYAEI
jgi:hypothetical protein